MVVERRLQRQQRLEVHQLQELELRMAALKHLVSHLPLPRQGRSLRQPTNESTEHLPERRVLQQESTLRSDSGV